MILWASKGDIGSWKLTEVVEQTFGRDCRGGFMHKEDCENKGEPTILYRIQHSLYWRQSLCWVLSVHSFVINLISMAWYMVWYIQYLWFQIWIKTYLSLSFCKRHTPSFSMNSNGVTILKGTYFTPMVQQILVVSQLFSLVQNL